MAANNVWSKVGVAVQTVIAATKTITGITKANPGVATSTSHGYTNGNILLLIVAGMTEVNYMVVRAANVAANTFELEGIDTTNYGTFTSGTAQLLTLGAAASTFQDLSASGGEANPIDLTTIHVDTTVEIPGVKSAIQYNFGSLWDPADAALLQLKAADAVKGTRAIQITFSSGAKVYFNAYPTCSLAPTGNSGGPVTTPVALKLNGPVVAYTS